MQPQLSIVVPVVNQHELTNRCFSSIKKWTDLSYELIWVDNGSDDHNFNAIKEKVISNNIPCKIIVNEENLGFVKATNQGIRLASGEYIILLNNDTEVTAHWDSQLIFPFSKIENVGAVGPITQNTHWQNARGIKRNLKIDLPDMNLPWSKLSKRLEKFKDKYVDVTHLYLSFFCVAIKKETFEKIGLLCEDLCIGLGDDDEFCQRLKKASYKLFLSLGTYIHHVHRVTFKALNYGTESLSAWNRQILKKRKASIVSR
jgi:GT2 family glycosyltransferase